MTFSELVALHSALQTGYKLPELLPIIDIHSQQFNNLPVEPDIQTQQYVTAINQNIDALRTQIAVGNQTFDQLISHVLAQIAQAGAEFDYEWHTECDLNAVQNVRQLPLSATTRTDLELIISNYNSWQFPSLEFNVANDVWAPLMVSADPLYLGAQHPELLDLAIDQFAPEYQRRVCPYVLKGADLSALPQEQFGFVLVWNYFNYLSMSQIQQHLESILKILRPGGVLMFSYNNANSVVGARMVENHVMSYAPRSQVFALLQHLGFGIIRHQERDVNVSWFEVRRPGHLSTTKSGQVLGELRAVGL